MKLSDLARHPHVREARLFKPLLEPAGLTCDSRRCDRETAFLALPGHHVDGHAYVDAARRAGAPVVLVSQEAVYRRLCESPETLAGVMLVEDGRHVLATLSAEIYGKPWRNLTLLGVTGTNGKTTVAHLVAQLMEALGEPCAVSGTLGQQLPGESRPSIHTTPEAPELHAFFARCVAAQVRNVAMEVSSIGIAEERTRGLPFAAAAFTNLTQDHLDVHDSLDDYRAAKYRLFTEYDTAAAVLNLDDPAGAELVRLLGTRALETAGGAPRVLTFGLGGGMPGGSTVDSSAVDSSTGVSSAGLTVRAADLRAGAEGGSAGGSVQGQLVVAGAAHPFRYRLLGRFNLSNMLAACGLLMTQGAAPGDLAAALEHCTGAPGRFEQVPLPAPFSVIVDYAHTPDALRNVLLAARPLTEGRLRVLFGCGGERDRLKRPLMGRVAEQLADEVLLCDDNPRGEEPEAILAEIAAGMARPEAVRIMPGRRDAIVHLLETARPGDLLLLAGKGAESYQEVRGVRHPFDDRQVVRDWAQARRARLRH